MGTEILYGTVHGSTANGRGTRDGARAVAVTPNGAIFSAEYLHSLGREGRLFVGHDADENDTVLSASTSYAATDPTFLLAVPDGTVAIPLWVRLVQAGSVAGGAISIHISIDNTNLYSSGGTSEAIDNLRTDGAAANSTLYSSAGSAIVASAATGARAIIWHHVIAPDVAPASADAAQFDVLWTPPAPLYVVGAGSFLIYTYAATTAPTWYWSIGWAEIPESELN